MPAYCPLQACSIPVHFMTFSFRIETITLPASLYKKVEVLGFCLTVSSLQYEVQRNQYTTFGLYLQMPLRRPLLDVPKLLEARILSQQSAFIPEEPEYDDRMNIL